MVPVSFICTLPLAALTSACLQRFAKWLGCCLVGEMTVCFWGSGCARCVPAARCYTAHSAAGFCTKEFARTAKLSFACSVVFACIVIFACILIYVCIQVPYDPDLPFLFFGEEMSMLARMWTNGWDVMAPIQVQTQYIYTHDHPQAHPAD